MQNHVYSYRRKRVNLEDYLWECKKVDAYFYLFICVMVVTFYFVVGVPLYTGVMMLCLSVDIALLLVERVRVLQYNAYWVEYGKSNELLSIRNLTDGKMVVSYRYMENNSENNIVFMVGKNDSFVYNQLLDVLTIKLLNGFTLVDGQRVNKIILRNSFDCDLRVIFKDFLKTSPD